MCQLTSRDFYTTGEMARVLGCAKLTVIRYIDRGRLKGFRLPGRQGARRCPKATFRQYLIEHDVPLARLEQLENRLVTAPE